MITFTCKSYIKFRRGKVLICESAIARKLFRVKIRCGVYICKLLEVRFWGFLRAEMVSHKRFRVA